MKIQLYTIPVLDNGAALEPNEFENLEHLEEVLKSFYYVYNHKRIHSSICYLSPHHFQKAVKLGFIEVNITDKKVKCVLAP